MPLTMQGYVKQTADELSSKLEARLSQNVPSWKKTTADVQSNILAAIIPGLLEYENIATEMINCYQPGYANDFFWNIFAENLNLNRRAKFRAQVMLLFSGDEGVIIPRNTIVSDDSGNEFEVLNTTIIPKTKQVYVNAYSDTESIVAANSLTTIKQVFNSSVSVTNPSSSFASIPEDTTAILKLKTQERIRSARNGSIDLAHSRLLEIEGVNPRLIKFNLVNYNVIEMQNEHQVFKEIQGIECIVGGGEPSAIALALFTSFLETKKLRSNPSNNETERTAEYNLKYLGTTIPIKWTMPKEVALQISISIGFVGVSITSDALNLAIKDALANYIESKQVGTPFSSRMLDSIIYEQLNNVAIPPDSMFALTYEIWANNVKTAFNTQGFLDEIKEDCYVTLAALSTAIIANPNS